VAESIDETTSRQSISFDRRVTDHKAFSAAWITRSMPKLEVNGFSMSYETNGLGQPILFIPGALGTGSLGGHPKAAIRYHLKTGHRE
jgi:hypothetical protein